MSTEPNALFVELVKTRRRSVLPDPGKSSSIAMVAFTGWSLAHRFTSITATPFSSSLPFPLRTTTMRRGMARRLVVVRPIRQALTRLGRRPFQARLSVDLMQSIAKGTAVLNGLFPIQKSCDSRRGFDRGGGNHTTGRYCILETSSDQTYRL